MFIGVKMANLLQERIAKQISEVLLEKFSDEFEKIALEFKKMENYINTLESKMVLLTERIEVLEEENRKGKGV